MRVAKASKNDIDQMLKLSALLETVDDGYYPSTDGEECAETFFDPDNTAHLRLFYDKVKAHLHNAPGGIARVVLGFAAALDSGVFDPDLDYLDLNPQLKRLNVISDNTSAGSEGNRQAEMLAFELAMERDGQNKPMRSRYKDGGYLYKTDSDCFLGWMLRAKMANGS